MKFNREEIKQHGINISMSTVATLIPVLVFTWMLIKPAVVLAVGEQLNEQVQRTVAKEVAPINIALSVILSNNIENIRLQIAALEFKRDFPPADDWKSEDALALTRLKNDLSSAEMAITAWASNDPT